MHSSHTDVPQAKSRSGLTKVFLIDVS